MENGEAEMAKRLMLRRSRGRGRGVNQRSEFSADPLLNLERDDIITPSATVMRFAALNLRPDEIEMLTGIPADTITKKYGRELKEGPLRAKTKVAETLYAAAIGGNVGAMIFFLKTQCGWRELDREADENLQPADAQKRERIINFILQLSGDRIGDPAMSRLIDQEKSVQS